MMQKSEISKVRLDIVCDGESLLSILMERGGRISRQGSGEMPADPFAVQGDNDGSIFEGLINALDERVFEHAGVYDHPDKAGVPITYSVAFLGAQPDEVAPFEFRLGTETADVGELLPYFVQIISKAEMATSDWYAAERAMASAQRDKA